MLPIRCQKITEFVCNQYKYWALMIVWIIQTPLRTAFHDTQRLLLEAYASNVYSNFVLFAPLMKK